MKGVWQRGGMHGKVGGMNGNGGRHGEGGMCGRGCAWQGACVVVVGGCAW